MTPIKAIPTHLITGFLGAGKTTLINALFAHKAIYHTDEVWGLLMNEFGQIGIDGTWLAQDGIDVREVSGGCICCRSQLPMQMAIARLLAKNPTRLIIEPTGLSHADVLVDELSQPHWQNRLTLAGVICVVNAKQWQDEQYRHHDLYQAHVKYADVVVISQSRQTDDGGIRAWITSINPTASVMSFEQIQTHWRLLLSHTHTAKTTNIQPLSNTLRPIQSSPPTDERPIAPYRYDDKMGDFVVGGWVLPSEWVFDDDKLQRWLMSLPNYARIKGVIRTDGGFISINMTAYDVAIVPFDGGGDNKLEMIFKGDGFGGQWDMWNEMLMDFVIKGR